MLWIRGIEMDLSWTCHILILMGEKDSQVIMGKNAFKWASMWSNSIAVQLSAFIPKYLYLGNFKLKTINKTKYFYIWGYVYKT